MTYVCWAVVYEGSSDSAYFDVLIPRLMQEIVLEEGVREATIPARPAIYLTRGSAKSIAGQICDAAEAFHLVFVHGDTGGRSLEKSLADRTTSVCEEAERLCEWRRDRCITITPRHETEAWVLADPDAVADVLGYRGEFADLGLPPNARAAEQLPDPKETLMIATREARGRRTASDPTDLYAAIAQAQNLGFLRESRSFRDCESSLRRGLASLGCIDYPT